MRILCQTRYSAKKAETELGREIQKQTGAACVVVNRIREAGREPAT